MYLIKYNSNIPYHFFHIVLGRDNFCSLYTFPYSYPGWTVTNIHVNTRDKKAAFDYKFYIVKKVSN